MGQKSLETVNSFQNTFIIPRGVPSLNTAGKIDYKVSKPPDLPYFSGVEPVPKEEGSFEQWIFQVKGSSANHTSDAICS